MLESALTLVVFLALFIGVFDLGTMFFVHQTITDRARNAARWGVVNPYDATSIQNLVLYGTTTPADGQGAAFGLTAGKRDGFAAERGHRPARGPDHRYGGVPGKAGFGLHRPECQLVGRFGAHLEPADSNQHALRSPQLTHALLQ
jgi:hypothetical protein